MANEEKVETEVVEEKKTSKASEPEKKETTEAPVEKKEEKKVAAPSERPPQRSDSRPPQRDTRRRNTNYRRFYRRRQKQVVPAYVDWKDVEYLGRFVPERGKIMPRRISGVSAKDQRRIARAIKRARAMALLPFVGD